MTPSKDQNIFSEKDENMSNGDARKTPSIDNKISEIEDRIKNLYEKSIPDFINVNTAKKEEESFLRKKLEVVSDNIKQISGEVRTTAPEQKSAEVRKTTLAGANEYDYLPEGPQSDTLERTIEDIEKKIESLNNLTAEYKSLKDPMPVSNDKDLSKKVFNNFYKDDEIIGNKDNVVKDKLERIDEQIKELKNSISSLHTAQRVTHSSVVEERLKSIEEKLTEEDKSGKQKVVPHGAITLRPKSKKEGLFNDVNLTEDYELGFRFYQLGFKTGFFNVKLDRDDEASRIATAEFFPNTFWSSVKQRSRWVAGIVFQNWKAHKWAGNLSTKYFLFRDRKSIFSFFSAFLSNIVIVYFIYSIVSKLMGWPHVNSLVGHSSVLWYLMIANLFFMISRLSHRFVFTYNWYGFRYAFFSIFRLPLDTIINFFAIARSLNVYKNTKTKTKAVWDSTSHY
ncbi:MAG: glycosyltransferase family 2 protein [Ignavibacteria bacterium]|nr:glycosyltransferase family 2 protein [Ignavibacteria bacterium]